MKIFIIFIIMTPFFINFSNSMEEIEKIPRFYCNKIFLESFNGVNINDKEHYPNRWVSQYLSFLKIQNNYLKVIEETQFFSDEKKQESQMYLLGYPKEESYILEEFIADPLPKDGPFQVFIDRIGKEEPLINNWPIDRCISALSAIPQEIFLNFDKLTRHQQNVFFGIAEALLTVHNTFHSFLSSPNNVLNENSTLYGKISDFQKKFSKELLNRVYSLCLKTPIELLNIVPLKHHLMVVEALNKENKKKKREKARDRGCCGTQDKCLIF